MGKFVIWTRLWSGKPRGFQVSVRDAGGAAVLVLAGTADRKGHARETVAGALEKLLDAERVRIVVNGERLEWIGAEVVGALVGDLFRMRDAGGDMAFACLSQGVKDSLGVLGVRELIRSYATEKAAIAALATLAIRPSPLAPERLKIGASMPEGAVGDGTVYLSLRGALNAREAPVFDAAIYIALKEGPGRIVVDCRDLLDLDPEHFISAVNKAKRKGGNVHFVRLGGAPAGLVTVLRLDKLLRNFDDPLEAARAFDATPQS